jgi:NhaP-type Na+/H+ or K+/H+ antiporter
MIELLGDNYQQLQQLIPLLVWSGLGSLVVGFTLGWVACLAFTDRGGRE